MSDSKYLPYQNPFSELETECNPLAEPAPEATVDCPPCPAECTPNPDAIVPDLPPQVKLIPMIKRKDMPILDNI